MEFGRFRDVKEGVRAYFQSRDLRGKTVLDAPAGKGRMTAFLSELGGEVVALDLFTHGTVVGGVTIGKADLASPLPLANESVDYILCQEGIEHLPNQIDCLREFCRVLKDDGRLVITTPSYSNLRARFYHFFVENNSLHRLSANEVDDVFEGEDGVIGCGHLFLVGAQKLRILAKLAGFGIRKVYPTKVSGTSLVLCVLFYPWLRLLTSLAFRRTVRRRKRGAASEDDRHAVLCEIAQLNVHPYVLLGDHLFVEFGKNS